MGKLPYVLAGVVLMTTQPILVKLSYNEDGKPEYSKFSNVLLTELGKAIFSGIMIVFGGLHTEIQPSAREMLQYAVPGFIYCINNWLVFEILTYVDPTTFQLLGQLKIVFTGILFRAILGRRLHDFQWLAIWQLACGATVSQIPSAEICDRRASLFGVALSVISCMFSALAGIYNEKIMKDKANVTIHWQNFQLYLWGILFCFIGDWISRRNGPQVDQGGPFQNFFQGYNYWAVTLLFNNMFMGLSISAIMKFVDNIARVYTHTVAMLITMVLGVVLWHPLPHPPAHHHPNLTPSIQNSNSTDAGKPCEGRRSKPPSPTFQMFLGIAIVSASAIQYNLNLDSVKERIEKAQQQAEKDMDDSDEDTDDEEPASHMPLKA